MLLAYGFGLPLGVHCGSAHASLLTVLRHLFSHSILYRLPSGSVTSNYPVLCQNTIILVKQIFCIKDHNPFSSITPLTPLLYSKFVIQLEEWKSVCACMYSPTQTVCQKTGHVSVYSCKIMYRIVLEYT